MNKTLPLEQPLHPHPLSNDLITEPLPLRGPKEIRERAGGFDPTSRRVIWTIVLAVSAFALIALVVTAFFMRGDWRLAIIGLSVVALFVTFVAAPVLLAGGTKVAQDEAVRDGATSVDPRPHAEPVMSGAVDDAPLSAQRGQTRTNDSKAL